MKLKDLLRLPDRQFIQRCYRIGHVDCKHDTRQVVLEDTIAKPIDASFKTIHYVYKSAIEYANVIEMQYVTFDAQEDPNDVEQLYS
jgi:hypothetical protein